MLGLQVNRLNSTVLTQFRYLSLCLSIYAIALLIPSSQSVAQPPSEAVLRQTQEVSDSIMSPYCPGVTLSACTSDDAWKLRREIEQWFSGGATRADVEQRLVTGYGPGVLGMPRGKGVGTAAWLVPMIFTIVLGLGIVALFRGSKRENIQR